MVVAYSVLIALFGAGLSYLLVWVITRPEQQTLDRSGSGGGDDERLNRTGSLPEAAAAPGCTLSTVSHMPTAVTLLITCQLLATSVVNFISFSEPFCCSALDILGLIAIVCLIGIVTVVGLQPQRSLADLHFPKFVHHQTTGRQSNNISNGGTTAFDAGDL